MVVAAVAAGGRRKKKKEEEEEINKGEAKERNSVLFPPGWTIMT